MIQPLERLEVLPAHATDSAYGLGKCMRPQKTTTVRVGERRQAASGCDEDELRACRTPLRTMYMLCPGSSLTTMRVDDENFSKVECAATASVTNDKVMIDDRVSLYGDCSISKQRLSP